MYLSVWGFDKDNQICELAIPFINPELFATIESERPKKQFHIAGADIKELLNWKGASGCLATDRIVVDGCKVGYMYRENPDGGRPDSGWRFFSGDESDEYANNPDNVGVYHLNTIANYDQDIIPLLNSTYGCAFGRDKNGAFQKKL